MLAKWQWPAGGWNCDRRPATTHPSVNESFPALRGLAAYARVTGDRGARDAADRAAEFFLRHRVAWSERTGSPIHPVVVRLQYPPYWHYDVLAGLRALLESGHLDDPRTADALDLVESSDAPTARGRPTRGMTVGRARLIRWSRSRTGSRTARTSRTRR